MKYFLFNKALDYKRGQGVNIEYDESGMWVKNKNYGNAFFLSRVLDSKENETLWHRIIIRGKGLTDASICLTIYATDYLNREYEGKLYSMDEFLADENISVSHKRDYMKMFQKKVVYNFTDILLHDVSGKYLWFLLEILNQGEEPVKIETMQIYFPKQTWIYYLPEIYQSEPKSTSFLERYLGIFQSLYDDLNLKIKELPMLFNPESVDGEFLTWLAEWIGERASHVWPEERLRILLKDAMEFYKIRGTVKSILKVVKLFTGEEPYIIEQHLLENYKNTKETTELLTKLYGNDPYSFTLIVKEECIPTNKEYKSLVRILDEVKPAHMGVHVVVIRHYIFLNSYSYLGINSTLGKYKSFALDELTVVPFASIKHGEEGLI